jgi:hypothetical protein
MNSGHPPLWPVLLAMWWKIFGFTIASSRFLLLIINVLVGYQLLKLLENNFPQKNFFLLVIIVFLEPTFLAQTTILNNDMILLLFTLLAYNIIEKSEKKSVFWYTLALTGILFANLRGMLLFSCILILDIIFYNLKLRSNINKLIIMPYVISAVIFLSFLMYQYVILGWVIKTPSPNWVDHRSVAPIFHMVKNIFSIIRNFLDYGRVVIMVLSALLIYKYFKLYKFKSDLNIAKLLVSVTVFSFGLSLFFIFFTNPIGHRYFMISYILLVILCLLLLEKLYVQSAIKKFNIIIIVAFISGHFYIYPSTISQGWDSSLAYFSYFENRDKLIVFIEDNKIDKSSIGTNLSLNSIEYSDLKVINKEMNNFSKLDLKHNNFVILSNIDNSTSDEDISIIKNEWILVKDFSKLGVYVSLYKNPNH